jgi:hypothetical protein
MAKIISIDGDELIVQTVGTQGPPGPQGLPGASFKHIQNSAASVWTINHNLGVKKPVACVDTLGREIEGDVVYVNDNTVTISFGVALAGEAYL